MALLNWSPDFAIGIGVFDKEHREIFGQVNELQAAVEEGLDHRVTGPLLNKLASRTVAHFMAEEEMMAAVKYPGLALHGIKHQSLLDRLDAFFARYNREGSAMDRHSLNFLHEWAATHIRSEDRNFGLWLYEHGKR